MANNIFDWTGVSAPFRIENGSVAKSTSVLNSKYGDSPHIEESIATIVRTFLGEWFTKNHIGTKFRSLVFNTFNKDFDTYIEHNLTSAIEEQDHRVSITELTVVRDEEHNTIKVVVKWDINPDVVQNYMNENGGFESEIDIETDTVI